MVSTKQDLYDVATSSSLTYQQKLYSLANTAERLFDPQELLGYSKEDMDFLHNDMICDLNEGYLIYRPRYIVPDYQVFVEKGCAFLDLPAPQTLDDLLDGLLILYRHVPSITSFPVYIGNLDTLIEPFLQGIDSEEAYGKIKRFLNHVDKTITDSFCHADIGPVETVAGMLILRAVIELENTTPNMTLHYDAEKTSDSFALKAVEACLKVSKPSFSNYQRYMQDVGPHALVSCYNALPMAGGAYSLLRLRLGTIAAASESLPQFMEDLFPTVIDSLLHMMDVRIAFLVEKAHFFDTSFLVKEGFLKRENFTAMVGIVGLADAVNIFLQKEGRAETFGTSARGDEIAHQILQLLEQRVNSHKTAYVERTDNHYLLHAQVGASISDEDNNNTPAHRIKVGQEPILPVHLTQAAQFHTYFPSGTGDLFAFDQTSTAHLESVLDIIKGAFTQGMRYITCYLKDTDLIRVTGYLVKKSEVEKARQNQAVLHDTTWFGKGTEDAAHVFSRRERVVEQ